MLTRMTPCEVAVIVGNPCGKSLVDELKARNISLGPDQIAMVAMIMLQGYCVQLDVCTQYELNNHQLFVGVGVNIHISQFVVFTSSAPEDQRIPPDTLNLFSDDVNRAMAERLESFRRAAAANV